MSTVSDRELPELIAEQMPYDGPHSAETVTDAAESISALVRYLNNATGPGNGDVTLKHAATVDRVIGYIESATHGLDQLLGQLSGVLEWQADEGDVYDDRRDRPGAQTAHAAAELTEDARGAAQALAGWLRVARDATTHIGNEEH